MRGRVDPSASRFYHRGESEGEGVAATDREIEDTRALCFELAAAAFANDQLGVERYEALAAQIADADNLAELELIQRGFPEVARPAVREPQLLSAQSSNLRREGRWVESPNILLHSRSSNIRLDFTRYGSERDFRIVLELDCQSSNLRIVVPQFMDVVEQIESRQSSVFRDKRGGSSANGAIVVRGAVSSTRVKVVRKKGR